MQPALVPTDVNPKAKHTLVIRKEKDERQEGVEGGVATAIEGPLTRARGRARGRAIASLRHSVGPHCHHALGRERDILEGKEGETLEEEGEEVGDAWEVLDSASYTGL